jgi:hypothetical protein
LEKLGLNISVPQRESGGEKLMTLLRDEFAFLEAVTSNDIRIFKSMDIS